jgi:hypothetical protein
MACGFVCITRVNSSHAEQALHFWYESKKGRCSRPFHNFRTSATQFKDLLEELSKRV